MEWIQATYFLPLWLQVTSLLTLTDTQGLTDCVTQRSRCWNSYHNASVYGCSGPGKLQHPEGHSDQFLLCKGDKYAACHCLCPPNKHFSSILSRCTRRLLSDITGVYPRGKAPRRNTMSPTPRSGKDIDITSTKPTYTPSLHDKPTKASVTKSNKDANEVLKPNVTLKQDSILKTMNEEVQHLGGIASPSRQHLDESNMSMLEDDAIFPAWAIALIVLCLVILFVLIILIFY